ncbi:hypothetical protein TgHK011_008652 [Trichoderma gracile]|nr:hypothetical protein TgHK011_008652 [Trichoderma gracile]
MSDFRKAKRCSTCAARRIACDRKSPSCSQCLLTGRTCGGYHRQAIFVQGDIGITKSRGRRRAHATDDQQPSSAPRVHAQPTTEQGKTRRRRRHTKGPAIKYHVSQSSETFSSELDYLISLIIENFTPPEERSLVSTVDGSAACLDSRVCGSWVTLLPAIAARSSVHLDVLQCAVKTLGYTILNNIPRALEEYGETLRLFSSTLGSIGEGSFEVLLAAILCLTLAEVLLGTEHNGWLAHTRGISKLIQGRGPDAFKDGTTHQLFTSFRVFMLLEAIQYRRETFLDEPAWKTVPFASEPQSLMQSLLDQISGLPALLQRLDTISNGSPKDQNEDIVASYKNFDAQLLRLENWETNVNTSAASRLLWWPVALSSDTGTAFPISYDEIRNAGGRASEALRSIICVDQMLGVGGVIVIHHTDCGLTHLRNEYLHKALTEKAPGNADEIAKMEFGEILDLEASVVEDMKILKDSPYLRKDLKVYGYVYDIKTGKLQEVKE